MMLIVSSSWGEVKVLFSLVTIHLTLYNLLRLSVVNNMKQFSIVHHLPHTSLWHIWVATYIVTKSNKVVTVYQTFSQVPWKLMFHQNLQILLYSYAVLTSRNTPTSETRTLPHKKYNKEQSINEYPF